MPDKKPQLPKKLNLGRIARSQEAKAPKGVEKGKIETNWKDINWTPTKLGMVIVALGIPYLVAIVVCFAVGNNLIAGTLIGIAVLVGLMFLALRFIEQL
ncbi:hypothetical protein [Pleurocapsa sp. PCC 7319]|uniref:hypothetical protein n=1 Tax=Pleurocapsa sp. PCC 7319 TaxID=118161 RepID=UPI00034DF424|nr:hypothetical protein [Pleurocapsa sp. PCC 7319]